MRSTGDKKQVGARKSKNTEQRIEKHGEQRLEYLKTGLLVKVTEFLILEELNELCLVNKTLKNKIF